MMDMRKVELFTNGKWNKIYFNELQKGDRFRLFESTGERVVDSKGCDEWVATSSSFVNEYHDLVINIQE